MPDEKVTTNRKARFDFQIFEKFEAGISLWGSEVKSIREGNLSLQDSFVRFEGAEAYVCNMHIKPYAFSRGSQDPTRMRKLLLRKAEINKLAGRISRKGFTCIPLSVYFNQRGKVKLEIALCQSKKQYDKRETLKRRDHVREMDRAMKKHKRK